MSSEALKWFGTVTGLKPTQNVLLRCLCAFHTKRRGCFPSQWRLAKETGVALSTVNLHLNVLEAKGHIKRVRERDPKTRRQRPTHYLLGFELDGSRNGSGTPFGDGAASQGGSGADSEKMTEPTPKSSESRLRNSEKRESKESENLTASADFRWVTSEEEGYYLMAYSHLVGMPTREATWPRPSSFRRRQSQEKGEQEAFRLERQALHGFPALNRMVECNARRRPVRVEPWVARAAGLLEPIEHLSREAEDWRVEHARRGWPWFQGQTVASKIYVPVGGINALDDFIQRLFEAMR
jgi:hypothetical protein